MGNLKVLRQGVLTLVIRILTDHDDLDVRQL